MPSDVLTAEFIFQLEEEERRHRGHIRLDHMALTMHHCSTAYSIETNIKMRENLAYTCAAFFLSSLILEWLLDTRQALAEFAFTHIYSMYMDRLGMLRIEVVGRCMRKE